MKNMGSFDEDVWNQVALDYKYDSCFIDDGTSPDFSWLNSRADACCSSGINIDFSQNGSWQQEPECSEKECPKKRGRTDAGSKPSTKACRERLRRGKLNDSFLELSSCLEPGSAAKTDKLVILNDAIRVLNQLRSENEEYKEENKKLKEEIESLKAEKNELREEKITLKAEKEKMEQQLKGIAIPASAPSGLMSPYPAPFHAGPNKIAFYPSYGVYPMWHYLPPSTRDTSRDHELRPPAA